MTIHEIYKQRQQQYQEYLVQQGVYNEKLATCKEALKNAIDELKQLIPGIQDEIILSAAKDGVAIAEEALEHSDDTTLVDSAMNRLGAVGRTIEEKIREVLN